MNHLASQCFLHGAGSVAGSAPSPALIRTSSPGGETRFTLGDPLVDSYLAFVAGRARPNTLRAVAFDLKAFFTVVDKDPAEVVAADVFGFLADQRGNRRWCGCPTASRSCRPDHRPPAVVGVGLLSVSGRPG